MEMPSAAAPGLAGSWYLFGEKYLLFGGLNRWNALGRCAILAKRTH